MIKLIVGNKGTGKTKALVKMVNEAAQSSSGNVVCIEKDLKLTYDLRHSVRLIDADNYSIQGFGELYGFISGVLAGNYDITDLFIDGTLKIGGKDLDVFAAMIEKLDKIGSSAEVNITITVSCDCSEIPQSVQKYITKF